MNRLLRGIIDWQGSINAENLAANYQRLRASKLEWVRPEDSRIFKFVSDFFQKELDLPSSKVVLDYFASNDDLEVAERLKTVMRTPPFQGANFNFVLKALVEEQGKLEMLTLLKNTQEISQKGLTIGEGRNKERLEGVKEAILFFQRTAADLLLADSNAQTRGDLREGTASAWDEYQEAKANPGQAYGKFTGIEAVDTACRGIKKGELWVHAAFTGELKSTLAVNWAYNLVTRYRSNAFYVSLEMPFKQIRRIIYVMHSAHSRWRDLGYEPLDYRKVRDGELSPKEEAFYKIVLEDFESNPDYCRFEIWCPDHEVNMNDIKMEAELLHKQMDVGMLVIDHGGITTPVEKNRDFNIALNSVLRDAKKLALHFNQGEGLPVLALFQINRTGRDDAEKNNGRYKLRALSHANEAERSADVVTTTFLDEDLKKSGKAIMCNLKNRDNPFFEPFELGIDFTCRRVFNLEVGSANTEDPVDTILEDVANL